jgi:serine/threonine protein kinase
VTPEDPPTLPPLAGGERPTLPPLPEGERPTLPPVAAEPAAADGEAAPARAGAHVRIVRRLARGGMGVVYEGQDERVRDPAEARRAVKVLEPSANSEGLEARFLRECEVAGRLDHPGIVRVLEAGRLASGELFCVMEFVEGETLATRFAARLPAEEVARLVASVARAVAHAHGLGVIHRDLKPGNVIVTPAGATRLIDFGIAKACAEDSLTATGMVMGTPSFMAPEQAADSKHVDARTDVFGLGAILYCGLTGSPPHEVGGRRLREMVGAVVAANIRRARSRVPSLDPALDALCMRALARDPARRFPSAAAFADALEGWLRGERVLPGPAEEDEDDEDEDDDAAEPAAEGVGLPVIAAVVVLAIITAGLIVALV